MVLQISFAIWLTLQIEVKALHICKPSHHFASTISAFHVRLCPPGPPPRAISLRPSALPTARARPPYRACPPSLQLPYAATSAMAQEQRWTFPRGDFSSEVDGAELTRTTNAAWAGRRMARRPGLSGNWRRPGLGGDWPA